MRIKRRGSSTLSGSGKRDRAAAFRRNHSVGQTVQGTFIKWASKGMAWVNIDGHTLLADLKSDQSPSGPLAFQIQQLSPNILLKVVKPGSGGGQSAGYEAVTTFGTLRRRFEDSARAELDALVSLPLAERPAVLLASLSENYEAAELFEDLSVYITGINMHLPEVASFLYLPWLQPQARRQATLVTVKARENDTPFYDITHELEVPRLGMVRLNLLHKGQDSGFKLQVQHTTSSTALQRYMKSRDFSAVTDSLNRLGVEKLPSRNHAGILAELLL